MIYDRENRELIRKRENEQGERDQYGHAEPGVFTTEVWKELSY